MKWLLLVLGSLSASACNDDCAAGVCPDFERTAPAPGPCESGYATDGYKQHCTYSYDGSRLTRVDCDWHESGADGEYGTDTSVWQYDAAGNVSRVDYHHDDVADGIGSDMWAWVWNGDVVEYWNGGWDGPLRKSGAGYEAASFSFLPLVGSDVIAPEPDFTRTALVGHTYTETREGQEVTRTRDDGDSVVYELDTSDHVIRRSDDYRTMLWTYDGDRITARENTESYESGDRHYAWHYEYDAGGNVAAWSDDDDSDGSGHEAYSYGCW